MSGYEDVYLQVSSLPISQLSLRFLLSCDDICDVPIPYIFVLKKYSIPTVTRLFSIPGKSDSIPGSKMCRLFFLK